MANSLSAKKRIRRNTRKAKINRERRSRIRSYIKDVENAVAEGKVKEAEEAFAKAQPEIDGGVAKGILHQNTAARKLSRLSGHIKDLKQAS